MWEIVLGGVLFVALLIPITAILVDSPLGRSFARRMEGQHGEASATPDLKTLQGKVDLLEAEVEEMRTLLSSTREEVQFVQKLLEKPKTSPPNPRS